MPPSDQPDRLDGRYFTIMSVTNNKPLCLQRHLIGGDVGGGDIIGDCKGRDGKLQLIKTFNGDYFLRMNIMNTQGYRYLDERLQGMYNPKMDELNPNPKHTWNIKDIGYGVYLITNTQTKKAFSFSTQSPAGIRLAAPVNKPEQQFYLR